MRSGRPDRIEKTRNKYAEHKVKAHGGESDIWCIVCAQYENKLAPGKLRRDSE